MSATDRHSQGGEQWTTPGGSNTAAVPAGVGTLVIKQTSGRICRVLVTATGTGVCTFYDNPSAASGTVIGVVPASATVGTVYQFDMPAANGIFASNAASGPALTVSYF